MAQAPIADRTSEAPRGGDRPPEVLVRGRWIPQELQERIEAFSPRTHLGALLKSIVHFVPDPNQQRELIEAACGIIVVQSRLTGVVMHSRVLGDPHCLHSIRWSTKTARCHICGEVWDLEETGLLSEKVITDAGVKNIVDVWNSGGTALTSMKFVGIGTGTTAEAAGDTALVTELTTEYNPNSTRATGTISAPSNNVAQVLGTNTLDSGTPAITETGLFGQAATGGGVLWDRFKYSAINLVGANGDGLQSTVKATFVSGG